MGLGSRQDTRERRRVTTGLVLWLWAAGATSAGAVCFPTRPLPPSPQKPAEPPPAPPEAPPQKPQVEAPPLPAAAAPPQERAPEAGETFIEWKYAINDTDLKGNVDRSFLHEGVNHILDFSFTNKYPLAGGRLLETLGVFRYTDDPRVDPERNSLQRGYARLTGPSFELVGGDHLVNYSRFSFNQNIKGLYVSKDTDFLGGFRFFGTSGIFTDRWGSIFRSWEKFADYRVVPDPHTPAKPFTRIVLAFRGEKPLGENQWVAVNFSEGHDLIHSLPRLAQVAPFDNQVVTVDWQLTFRRNLRWSGEAAMSASQFDARYQQGRQADYAGRVELTQQWQRYRWRVEYSRFMPNFFSVNARQVQDLQDLSAQGTYDFSKSVSFTATYRRTNDNLPGNPVLAFVPRRVCNDAVDLFRLQPLSNSGRTLTDCDPVTGALLGVRRFDHIVDAEGRDMTTVVQAPEAKLAVRSLPFWPRLVLEAGYRERAIATSNRGSFRATTQTSGSNSVTFLTPLFRDRATRTPFFDLSFPVGTQTFRVTYEYRRNRDRVQPENSTFTHYVAASYRLPSLFIRRWTLTTDLRFETQRESKQVELEALKDPVSGLPIVDPLTLRPLVRRQSGGDQTRTLQGSFTLEFPKYFTLDGLYRELNAALLSSFDSGGVRQFGNGGYRRPKWRAQLQYRIRNDENKFFLFTAERNLNTFFVLDPTQPDQRSFREKIAQITFVYRFRR